MGGIAALSAASAVGVAFAPALLSHAPLGLIALSPVGRHLVMVAAVVPFVAFVVVATVRRTLMMFLAYKVGEIYGDRVFTWVKERSRLAGQWISLFERLFERAGPLVLFLVPGFTSAALAGASGMSLPLSLLMILLGQAGWMSVTFYVGDALKEWTLPLIRLAAEHMVEATVVCLLLVGAYEFYRRKSGARGWAEVTARGDD
jgi:membrane protein DedA with SNARE-associated domain